MERNHVAKCQVDRCSFKADARHRVCKVHSIASSAIVSGVAQRFCYYCGEFHLLLEFDENKICRTLLADQNQRNSSTSVNLDDQPGHSSSVHSVGQQSDAAEPPEEFLKSDPMLGPDEVEDEGEDEDEDEREDEDGEDEDGHEEIRSAVTISTGLGTGAVPSAAKEGSSSSVQTPFGPEELCDSIVPGSQMTDYICPHCHASLLLCLDGLYQCVRSSCWSKWMI